MSKFKKSLTKKELELACKVLAEMLADAVTKEKIHWMLAREQLEGYVHELEDVAEEVEAVIKQDDKMDDLLLDRLEAAHHGLWKTIRQLSLMINGREDKKVKK